MLSLCPSRLLINHPVCPESGSVIQRPATESCTYAGLPLIPLVRNGFPPSVIRTVPVRPPALHSSSRYQRQSQPAVRAETSSSSGSKEVTLYGKETAGIFLTSAPEASRPSTGLASGRGRSRSTAKWRGVTAPPQPLSIRYAFHGSGVARSTTRTCRAWRTTASDGDRPWTVIRTSASPPCTAPCVPAHAPESAATGGGATARGV